MKAVVDQTVVADSDETIVVDGHHYFPLGAVRLDHLQPTDVTIVDAWKGEAAYYDLVIGDKRMPNAAWRFPEPTEAAEALRDHVAFSTPPVEVTSD